MSNLWNLRPAALLGVALLGATLGACAAHTEEASSPAAPASTGPARPLLSPATGPSASPTEEAPSAVPAAPPPSASVAAVAKAEPTTAEKARAVFDQRCASCHMDGTNAKAEKHFKLDHGALAGHHAGSLGPTMRQVLGMNGGKATMPPGGPVLSEEDRKLLVAWAEEQDRTAPKHHEGHTH